MIAAYTRGVGYFW